MNIHNVYYIAWKMIFKNQTSLLYYVERLEKSFNYANFKKIRVTCKTQQECCAVDVNFVPLV